MQLPTEVLDGDFDALARGEALPYARVAREATGVEDGPMGSSVVKGKGTMPLDHA